MIADGGSSAEPGQIGRGREGGNSVIGIVFWIAVMLRFVHISKGGYPFLFIRSLTVGWSLVTQWCIYKTGSTRGNRWDERNGQSSAGKIFKGPGGGRRVFKRTEDGRKDPTTQAVQVLREWDKKRERLREQPG